MAYVFANHSIDMDVVNLFKIHDGKLGLDNESSGSVDYLYEASDVSGPYIGKLELSGFDLVIDDLSESMTAGTITALSEHAGDGTNFVRLWGISKVTISAAALQSAMETPSMVDDLELVRHALSGDDEFEMSQGGDRAWGYDGNDSMNGHGGSDRLHGGNGNDRLAGGTGDDKLSGEAGNDVLIGGDGQDTAIFAGSLGRFAVSHDAMKQTFTLTDTHASKNEGTDTVSGVEIFQFNGTAYTLSDLLTEAERQANTAPEWPRVTSGGSVAENAAAGTRVATLAAKDVDDHAVSYAITDAEGNRVTDARFEIVGNKIQVRAGASLDWEAAQSHTLYVRASDQFASSAPSKIVIGVTDRAEVIQLAAGGAVFTEAGVTEISVRGGSGNDRLTGGAKSDALSGGAGQDTIEGGAGSDRLEGGAGQDTLTGGTGADDFIFASVRHSAPGSDSRDVIVGFSKGSDDIVVSSIDAKRGVPGDQAFCLDTNDSFSAGEIRQKVTSKGLLIEFNTDSDAAAEMAILVQGLTSQLSASDFLL